MKKKAKHSKQKTTAIVKVALILIFIICIVSIVVIKFRKNETKPEEYKQALENVEVNEEEVTEEVSERMLQVQELKQENNDIVGWVEIANTAISFPVVQGSDNEYYLKHNYKKEYSNDGAIFLDKDYDWSIPSSNLLLYGHNNKNGNMFQSLLDYQKESFYKEHPTIRFTTPEEDCEYEIIAVFFSRVYYTNEKNVFRYYYFVNAKNEAEFDDYVKQSKKASIYDTGKTAQYGDQLLTLSTCEYSQEDGRFAVVARKIPKEENQTQEKEQ